MKVLLIVLLAGLAAESSASLSCKTIQAIANFELKEMAGTWYEFKWYSKLEKISSWLFGGRKCSKQFYEYDSGETEKLLVTITETKSNGNTTQKFGIVVYKNSTVKNGDINFSVVRGDIGDDLKMQLQAYNRKRSGQHPETHPEFLFPPPIIKCWHLAVVNTASCTTAYWVLDASGITPQSGKLIITKSKSVVVLVSTQNPSDDDKKIIEEGILEAHNCGGPAPSDYKQHSDEECKSNK